MEKNWFWGIKVWVAVAAVAVIMVAKVAAQVWWRPRKIRRHFARQGIRGPQPNFFLGNMREIVGSMMKASAKAMVPPSHNILPRVLPFYHQWKKIYGSCCLIWFGPTARLAISDPSLIREVYVSRSELFEKYESHPLVKKLEGNGLISLKGDMWAHRRKTISPIFHLENLKLMIPTVGKSVGEMLDKWSLECSKSSGGKAEIDVSRWFERLTEEVITRTIFGGSYDDGKVIYRLQSQQMIYAAESFQKVFIPGYKYLPTSKNRAIWRLDREIETQLLKLINKKKEKLLAMNNNNNNNNNMVMDELVVLDGAGGSVSMAQDLLEHLIRDKSLSEMEMVEECKSFFFAGKDTTANILTWSTVLLAMHPQWQQLAREEVLRVCGSRDTPTKDDVTKLKTLQMITYEVLRLYPAAVATIRRAKKDVTLGGYRIPEGTELLIPIIAVHHDPNVWGPDVHEFNPARFRNGLSQAARFPNAFMGFGLGARQCIGQNLAMLQAKLALSMILQRFTFDVSPNYKHAPTVLLFLYPQHGAPVIFRSL